jgi:hypothetical protein
VDVGRERSKEHKTPRVDHLFQMAHDFEKFDEIIGFSSWT